MTKTTLLIAGAILITCTHSIAADVDRSLHGTWKGRYAESCAAVDNFTTEDFIIIKNNKVERYEGTCLVRKSVKQGNNFTISGLCESEGMTETFTMGLRLDGKNHLIVDGKIKYDRCK